MYAFCIDSMAVMPIQRVIVGIVAMVAGVLVVVMLVLPTSYWIGGNTWPCGSALFPSGQDGDRNCASAYGGQWVLAAVFGVVALAAAIILAKSRSHAGGR